MMDLQLKGKTALVTGSTSGIGKAIAASLIAEGAAVIINGRREEKVNETIRELEKQTPDARLYPAAFDLGTAEGCGEIFQQYPDVDILVNNLGIFEPAEYFDIPDEEWLRFFEVNIMSGVRLTRRYAKRMIERKEGRVIFIASEAAVMPSQEMAHYSATKTTQPVAVTQSGRAHGRDECDGEYGHAGLHENRGRRNDAGVALSR